jgi:hypothetical protein
MPPIPLKVYLAAVGVLAAVVSVALWNAHERQVGRLEVALASSRAREDTLQVALVADVVQLVAVRAREDSLALVVAAQDRALAINERQLGRTRSRLDSLLADLAVPAVPATGTPTTPGAVPAVPAVPASVLEAIRAYEHQADSTVAACKTAKASAADELAACDLRAATAEHEVGLLRKELGEKDVQIKAVEALAPSKAGTWTAHAIAFAIGVLTGFLGHR